MELTLKLTKLEHNVLQVAVQSKVEELQSCLTDAEQYDKEAVKDLKDYLKACKTLEKMVL